MNLDHKIWKQPLISQGLTSHTIGGKYVSAARI
jgi:hypothetical protein